MKNIYHFLKNKEKNNVFGMPLFKILLNCYEFIVHRLVPAKIMVSMIFFKKQGYKLNLKNPKTLNEKLQWKKFNDKKENYIVCSDKFMVRDVISKEMGNNFLIPLLFETINPDNIPFDDLGENYIIKSNHGSGQNIIIKDKNSINKNITIKECKKWLKINYYHIGKEWQYKNIKPRIIIEKLLMDKNGEVPDDYKFHCFNGKVEFIQVDTGRFSNHKRSFFNIDWKLLPFTWCGTKNGNPSYLINNNISKPDLLKEMIGFAQKLSKNFNYVRVDLYSLDNKIYFGELTFTHGSGFESFFPNKYDAIYGEKLI